VWRFYYSYEPFLYDGPYWPIRGVGPVSSEAMLNRILRVALFVNVTLPEVLERSKALDTELKEKFQKVGALREESFESFSPRRVNALHSAFSAERRHLPTIISEVDRIERSLGGVDQLREYLMQPLAAPLDTASRMSAEQQRTDERDPYRAFLGKLKSCWQDFREEFTGELKKPAISIMGGLCGAGAWLGWLYLR
jgi:hypothetical protein